MSSLSPEVIPNNSLPICDTLSGEEIVISGISGIFPSSTSVSEFMKNLYDKVDMVICKNMNFDHPEIPKYEGKITGLRKFDAQFFRVTYNQAFSLDSMCRKLLEHAYSAIFDSGINPMECQGSKLGVYIGSSYLDSSNMTIFSAFRKNGFIISGGSKCMFSNRISFFLDGKAPSVSVDCSCASVMVCLEQAYNDMKTGICDAALVGGCQACFHPFLSLNLKRYGLLCLDGKTKCFDKTADGYVRSEAVCLIFLQKAKNAKRIYAEIRHVKTKYGLKPGDEFVNLRKPDEIKLFLEEFYNEAGVCPSVVEYVEANGAATVDADANELQAISEVFAKDNHVMVGCVKSNMGNSEPASGACAITKLCLAYQKGKLSANLHYNDPLDISAIKGGKVQILTENEPFNREYTAINNFSLTGMNCHVLLKGHFKPKYLERYLCNIPRLILVSGRHEEGLLRTFETIKNEPIDPEVFGMLHNIYQVDTVGHTARGFAVYDSDENQQTVLLSQSAELYQGTKRPLWLVFSGMGSQWAGMGAELMRIPIFAAAIEKCHKSLEPMGVDIIRIITEQDASVFNYILNCFVGISAVQIGLIDILKEMGIVPDYIIGHSLGEIGCAYFDGCFTLEETMLAAYSRGKVSVETDFIKGAMAAVGLGYSELLRIVPPEIDIACHNSFESSTISGPADSIQSFVADLKAKGVFAKEVPSANIAYHSRYIEKAAPEFLRRLSEVVKKPVRRSEKWICTSVPKEKWEETSAQFSSSEYHTNNLLSPVYFEESARLIPPNAVVVEVAPHGLLQAILKRSHPGCTHIPLTNRSHSDPLCFLFEAFGKIYQAGLNLKISVLYPKIEFPVSTETPLISHFVEWYHNEDWPTAIHDSKSTIVTPTRTFALSLQDEELKCLTDRVVEENILFPEAAILCMIWETFAMFKGVHYENLSVAFRDVHFHNEIVMKEEEPLKMNIMITKGDHRFEVTRENVLIANGYLDLEFECLQNDEKVNDLQYVFLNSKDVYQIMHKKGYHFKNEFQSILCASYQLNTAYIKWVGNWITFLDGILQFNLLARNCEGVSVPKLIKSLIIDVNSHRKETKNMDENNRLIARINKDCEVMRCGGVEIKDIIFQDKPNTVREPDVLKELSFIPYNLRGQIDLNTALYINLEIVAENSATDVVSVSELLDAKFSITETLRAVSENISDTVFNIKTINRINNKIFNKCPNLLVTNNFLQKSVNDKTSNLISTATFVLSFEETSENLKNNHHFDVLTLMNVKDKFLVLLRKPLFDGDNVKIIHITEENEFSWMSSLQYELEKRMQLILVSDIQQCSGLFGLVKTIRKKYDNKVRLFIVDNFETLPLNHERDIFKKQMQKNLIFNVYKKAQWGSYYYLPCSKYVASVHRSFKLTNAWDDIDSVKWVECDLDDNHSQSCIQVHFAGPTVRDAQQITSFEADHNEFGMDYSGIDCKGNRVMGLISGGALASTIQPDSQFLWPVPDHWTLEEAATIPFPYVLAAYCLTIKSKLNPGMSVFVTRGSDALGQAVINICLTSGCTVYTSVEDSHKKHFLMKLFPKLNEKYIGFSSDSGFYMNVVINTKNKRCDLVINCNSGVRREHAMKCVACYGTYLDINNYDMIKNKDFGMFFLREAKSYCAVNLSNIFMSQNDYLRKYIRGFISDGIASGLIKPISYIMYPLEAVSRAFRLLSLEKQRGRVLIKIKDCYDPKIRFNIIPRIKLSSKATYLVICHETDLGTELANRLIKRGARNLTLHIKNENITGYLHLKMACWKNVGANVKISTANLQTERDCVKFLRDDHRSTLIHGIFIVQGFCKGKCDNKEDFVEIKAELTSVVSNLDTVSTNNCPELRYFAIISRMSQTVVHEYTTSALENICQKRADIGLPSLMFRAALPIEESLKKSTLKMQFQSIETVLNAFETSLKLNYKSILTYNAKNDNYINMLNKLSKILAIKSIHDIDENIAIKDLALPEPIIDELKTMIKNTNHSIFIENFDDITIMRLKTLGNEKIKINTKFDYGLDAFYTFAEIDEFIANEVMVPMTTLANTSAEDEKELDTNETFLMLIPGFEGHHKMYKSLCERLKIGAVTLQLLPDSKNYNIRDIAMDMKRYISRRFNMKSKFYLLGHSFGVDVALELAYLLEKDGHIGTVICLDSSPDILKTQIKAYLGGPNESQLQNILIEHFYCLFSGQQSNLLSKELESIENWHEKVDRCVYRLKKNVSCTTQYLKDVIRSAYTRILLAKNYQPKMNLNSDVVLLKGLPHPEAKSVPFDYNLSKYTKKPVTVLNITSDVATAASDYRVPNLVNQLLDSDFIADYNKKNLCDVYSRALLGLI